MPASAARFESRCSNQRISVFFVVASGWTCRNTSNIYIYRKDPAHDSDFADYSSRNFPFEARFSPKKSKKTAFRGLPGSRRTPRAPWLM